MAKDKKDKKDSKALPTDPVLRKKEEARRRALYFKNLTSDERRERGQMGYDMLRATDPEAYEALFAPEEYKKGGLARRKRKSDGGLKVGQRKIAKGCGAIMSNRRKKTLYR
mgnify:CR=1 FL=1